MNYFAKLPNVILVTLDVVDPVSIVAGVDTVRQNLSSTGVYNASTAALMSWSETLRLELQPFNIRVISLVTGSVATNKALPEIEARGVRKDISSKSAPADFAREVVKDVLGGASGPVWRGAIASIVKFVSKYMPTTVLDRAMKGGTGLKKLP
ncbi:hypothetical protein ETB97_005297 [Aspergillus alliaceus]|uniref:Uncharacterized protein n=1 Tax=Petromyces alliaceus TaxID=209559 RepID=A0A8H5ZZ85_PETAA|nr:hypothetical protein ETB97_005297 [Aspergillus burnettii]